MGAVADGALLWGGELGEGHLGVGIDEEGVVSEALMAARGRSDVAVAFAAEEGGVVVEAVGGEEVAEARGEGAVGEDEGEDADEASAALVGGVGVEVAEALKEEGVVLFVGGVGASEAGAVDAGGTVEGVDDEAGVVGEGGKARSERGGACLFEGVSAEVGGIFDDVGDVDVEGGEGDGLQGITEEGAQEGVELAGFSGVAGGDEESVVGHGWVWCGGRW